jgi:hypothetical protein
MQHIRYTALLFIAAVFSGCADPVAEVNPNMLGNWQSGRYESLYNDGIELMISGGNSKWTQYPQHPGGQGESGTIYAGKARIKDGHFQLKKIDLPIVEYPGHDATGNYRMILGSRTFYAALFPTGYGSIVDGDTLTLFWECHLEDNSNMVVDYRANTAATWSTVHFYRSENYFLQVGTSRGYLTQLLPGTTYEWRMKSVNGEHESHYTPVQTFTTQ